MAKPDRLRVELSGTLGQFFIKVELMELEADHRRHAEVENAIRDLKYGVGLNHMPSARFAANGAWLAIQVMAHNLARWTARIGLGERTVITKTLRRRVFALVERITVGDDAFLTNPLTGAWESLPQNVSPLGYFNPRQGIAAIMSQVTEVVLEGKETDRETPYIIIGNVPSEALKPLLGNVAEGELVEVRLKIETESLRLLEARFSGVVTPGEKPGIVRNIALSRFNQPVAIEPPT